MCQVYTDVNPVVPNGVPKYNTSSYGRYVRGGLRALQDMTTQVLYMERDGQSVLASC